jgi:SAM-dependent methyltransferase
LTDPIERRVLFDDVAELYDRARPTYPEALFDDLFAVSGLGPRSRLLEIGCGTGQATRALASRAASITCIELGARLAALARQNLGAKAHVINAPFEAWDPHGEQFDAVFAAAAWHWVDPTVRFARAASVLRPNGVLAIVSGGHAFPAGFDPFFTEIQSCYKAIGEGMDEWPPPEPDNVPDGRAEILASGLFDVALVKRYVWTNDLTAGQYIDLLETFSGHRVMTPENRARLYAEVRRLIGPRLIRMHSLAILHIARRRQ